MLKKNHSDQLMLLCLKQKCIFNSHIDISLFTKGHTEIQASAGVRYSNIKQEKRNPFIVERERERERE